MEVFHLVNSVGHLGGNFSFTKMLALQNYVGERSAIDMDKIIDKISAYNIFTNFLPGVIYCFLVEKFFGISLIQDDFLVALFLYYFTGMVISRISSVVLEPMLKLTKFVNFVDYKRYVSASKEDDKIRILLETSNSYRSMIALLICVVASGVWVEAMATYPAIHDYSHYILSCALIILFLLAYKKQTRYIVARVEQYEDQKETVS